MLCLVQRLSDTNRCHLVQFLSLLFKQTFRSIYLTVSVFFSSLLNCLDITGMLTENKSEEEFFAHQKFHRSLLDHTCPLHISSATPKLFAIMRRRKDHLVKVPILLTVNRKKKNTDGTSWNNKY